MQLTPAQKHFLRVSAQQEAAAAQPEDTMEGATGYELMLAQLGEHKRRLHDLQSIERRIELKRELLPEYVDYIEGALAGGKGAQDDVLTTLLVWLLDVEDYPQAFAIAEYALKHGMTLPDQYKRQLACLVAEEVATAQLTLSAAEKPLDLPSLQRAMCLTAEHDMPDEVRAKLHKALGYALRDAEHPDNEAALGHLRRAIELHDKAGVKKDIERLETVLKNSPQPQEGSAPQDETKT
jgi:hypothetical protein